MGLGNYGIGRISSRQVIAHPGGCCSSIIMPALVVILQGKLRLESGKGGTGRDFFEEPDCGACVH